MADFSQFSAEDEASKQPITGQPDKDGLSLGQRLIASWFFDTQPKRRAAYLKQNGFELDPKDDNKFRPLGSNEPFTREIDPGGYFNLSQYKKHGFSEFGKDLLEGAGSMIMEAPIEAVANTVAIGAATAAGVPSGGAAAAPVFAATRGVTRATMFQVMEQAKDKIGDFVLNENVPPDQALRYVQAGMAAVAPEVIAKGVPKAAGVIRDTFQGISDGARNLMKIGGNSLGPTAWDQLKSNWRFWTDPKNSRYAKQNIDDIVDKIFGRTPIDKGTVTEILPDSMFQQKLTQLEVTRQAEAARLSANPDASVNLQDFLNSLSHKELELSNLPSTPERQAGLKWLKDAREDLVKVYKGLADNLSEGQTSVPGRITIDKTSEGPITAKHINLTFSEADKLVSDYQNAAYKSPEWAGAKPIINDILNGAQGLNNKLKQKATDLGSSYTETKAKEAKIFQTFDAVAPNINKSVASRTVIGDELHGSTTGRGVDEEVRRLSESMKLVDDALGTQTYGALQSGQAANQIFKAVEGGGTSGSRGVLTAGTAGYVSGKGIGLATGLPSEMTGTAGAAIGVAATRPQVAIPAALASEWAAKKLTPAVNATQSALNPENEAIRQILATGAQSNVANASEYVPDKAVELLRPEQTNQNQSIPNKPAMDFSQFSAE